MRIPDNLHPRNVANALGVSVSTLALELGMSYHTLQGWNRRGSAPPHAVKFLEAEVPKVAARLAERRGEMDPEEAVREAEKHPPRPVTPDPRALPAGMSGLLPRRRTGKKGEEN